MIGVFWSKKQSHATLSTSLTPVLHCNFGMAIHQYFPFSQITWNCFLDCNDPQPLGIANHKILDSQMTASSRENDLTRASLGRLHTTRIHGKQYGSWVMKVPDAKPWIQVDFLKNTKITHMLSQGNYHIRFVILLNNLRMVNFLQG